MIEPIKHDMQLSDIQFSLLHGLAFSLFYAFMGMPIALLADKFSRPKIIAIGIALPLVAWFGFDPKGANSPESLHGLLLVFALGPAIAHALSAALIYRFPLDEAAHATVRATLARRDAAPDPAQ